MDPYFLAKALHLVGMVTWFAGLFYMVRLLVYRAEAQARPEDERDVLAPQLELMQRRLWYGITWPSMIATVLFGTWLMMQGPYMKSGWLHIKLALVVLLIAYHVVCGSIRKQQISGRFGWTSMHLRMWNEGATLFLVAIVFLAVFKNGMSAVWGAGGMVTLGVVLMVAIRFYRKAREKSSASASAAAQELAQSE